MDLEEENNILSGAQGSVKDGWVDGWIGMADTSREVGTLVGGTACAKAGDQHVLLMVEAWGTRKVGGWNGRKREAEMRS